MIALQVRDPYTKLLYKEARRRSGEALTLKTAEEILKRAGSGETALIVSGFRIPPLNIQETDGVAGSAILSKCLKGLGFRPFIVIEDEAISIRSFSKALKVTQEETMILGEDFLVKNYFNIKRGGVGIIPLNPKPKTGSWTQMYYLVRRLNPSITIFVEKPSPNRKGVYHNMLGKDVTESHIDTQSLIQELRRNSSLTVGIGDGGNEVGMGIIEEAVRKYVPYGQICNCPCRGGIASSLNTDELIVSSISDIGVYGLVSLLHYFEHVEECILNSNIIGAAIIEAVHAGAIDSFSLKRRPSVDGIPLQNITQIAGKMSSLIQSEIKR